MWLSPGRMAEGETQAMGDSGIIVMGSLEGQAPVVRYL